MIVVLIGLAAWVLAIVAGAGFLWAATKTPTPKPPPRLHIVREEDDAQD